MAEPRTAADWWDIVEDQWSNLLAIIFHHIEASHAAYEEPGNAKSPATGRTIREELTHLRDVKDTKLCRYFAAAWCLASDAYAWSVPGWGQLCDLCSEEYVLYEGEVDNLPTADDLPTIDDLPTLGRLM